MAPTLLELKLAGIGAGAPHAVVIPTDNSVPPAFWHVFVNYVDATALCRGGLRSLLQEALQVFVDATALCRGGFTLAATRDVRRFCGCHGLVPWRVHARCYKRRLKVLWMRRPCAVEGSRSLL